MTDRIPTIKDIEEAKRLDENGTLVDRLRDYGSAGMFFLVAKAADSFLTAYNANRCGTSVEANPLVTHLMDSLGVEEGLLLKNVAEIGIVLPLAYKGRRFMNTDSKNLLYAFGAVHAIGAASNLLRIVQDYFT